MRVMDSSPHPAPRTTALRLTGADALGLLHRVSTQSLLDLAPGEARATLFCDFRGRLLHRAIVHRARDGAVWLLRDDAPGAELASFVDRYVFRDDVRIEDRSAELPVARHVGAVAGASEESGIPRLVVVGDESWAVGEPVPDPADERARVEAGHPAHGHEIAEEFNPYEVGLGDEVHLEKGCYTGQEALQRLVTYRSVRRRLTRVAGAGPAPRTPARLEWRDGAAGWVTTAVAARRPAEGWIGLAVIKVEALESSEIPTLDGKPLSSAPEPLVAPPPLRRA